MKKNGILKALIILLVIYAIASWIIPVGYFNNGGFVTGKIDPVGLVDLIEYPIISLTSEVFLLTILGIIFVGGLYGVMQKTGLYNSLVESVGKKMKGNEELFLIITTFVLALLASLTSLTIPLFVVVPFVAGVVLYMGYDKITALLSSVGAILVGNMATTYGFNIAGYINHFYEVDLNSNILFKIILFVLLVGTLILFLLGINKKTVLKTPKKDELKEIPYYSEESKKNVKKLLSVIVLVLAFILVLVGMYNWYYSFNVVTFKNLYESIFKVEYNGLPILSYILGDVVAIGYWNNYEFAVVLVIVTFIIGKIGKLKLEEIVEAFIDGVKKMLPVAVFALLANIIFLFANSRDISNGVMYGTICNYFFGLGEKMQILSIGATSLIGGLLYNDFPYMINVVSTQVIATYTNLNLITFIQYAVHGLVQLVAPTSVLLVAGLTYLEIPYMEYLKKMYKFILGLFIIILALAFIMILI